MMIGRVNGRYEAIIPISLMSMVTREFHDLPARIDTGLDHFLVLPRTVITQSGYSIAETQTMIMGNEERHEFDETIVGILWDGEARGVRALVSETETLVGVRLLAGCHLTATMIPGGSVSVDRLLTT